MSNRKGRVGDLIQAELARILHREMKDPRVGLATISSVQVTADLSYAEVAVSVLGDDEEARQEAVRVLQQARGFLRSSLARALSLRKVPELRFALDRGAEHSQRIDALLGELVPTSDAPSPTDPDETNEEPSAR